MRPLGDAGLLRPAASRVVGASVKYGATRIVQFRRARVNVVDWYHLRFWPSTRGLSAHFSGVIYRLPDFVIWKQLWKSFRRGNRKGFIRRWDTLRLGKTLRDDAVRV